MATVDARRVEALIEAATARADTHDRQIEELRASDRVLEHRIHTLEMEQAEARGASSGWSRVPPWIAIILSGLVGLHQLGVF